MGIGKGSDTVVLLQWLYDFLENLDDARVETGLKKT